MKVIKPVEIRCGFGSKHLIDFRHSEGRTEIIAGINKLHHRAYSRSEFEELLNKLRQLKDTMR